MASLIVIVPVHLGKYNFCYVSTALVALANEMLVRLHVDVRVRSCADVNSLFFITLYEGLCAEHVKGKPFPDFSRCTTRTAVVKLRYPACVVVFCG